MARQRRSPFSGDQAAPTELESEAARALAAHAWDMNEKDARGLSVRTAYPDRAQFVAGSAEVYLSAARGRP
jgi:hypothetical protein